MASPTIAGTTEGGLTAAGTDLAVTLPAGGSESDEYIVIVAKGSVVCTINALADWTELLDESVAAGLAIIRYTGAGVPSNPTFVQSASSRSVWGAYRITGADKSIAPQVGTTATGTSVNPNSPSVTVTGGPKDILAISCFAGAGELADDDTLVTTFPTNYTSGQIEKTGGVGGNNLAGILGSSARQATGASSEDPGTYTLGVSRAWRAQTIVVHPGVPQHALAFDMPLGLTVDTALQPTEHVMAFDFPLGLVVDTNLTTVTEHALAFDLPLGFTVDTALSHEAFLALAEEFGLIITVNLTAEGAVESYSTIDPTRIGEWTP